MAAVLRDSGLVVPGDWYKNETLPIAPFSRIVMKLVGMDENLIYNWGIWISLSVIRNPTTIGADYAKSAERPLFAAYELFRRSEVDPEGDEVFSLYFPNGAGAASGKTWQLWTDQ